MDKSTFYAILFIIFFPIGLASILSFCKSSVFHIKEEERGVLMKNATSIKIFPPGWTMMNPFAGKADVVKITAQSFSFSNRENYPGEFYITYKIENVESAVKAGAGFMLFLLERSQMPARKKKQILETGNFDPIMCLIENHIQITALLIYVTNRKKYDEKQIESYDKLVQICSKELKNTFSEKGIEILEFQIHA